MARVLYFSVIDPNYPRNERIRRYLAEQHGADVDIVPARVVGPRWKRYGGQLVDALRAGRQYDVVVLSEFSIHFFWASWLAAKRAGAVHVVDFFVGMHETQVADWGRVAPRSPKARALQLMDRVAILSGDVVLTDTTPRAHRFQGLVHERRAVHALPVGAPAWAADLQRSQDAQAGAALRIIYYGNYLPLHGLELFVDAVTEASAARPLHLTLVGSGGLRATVEAQVRRALPPGSFEFLDYMDTAGLRQQIQDCDVVVGIFGGSDKAAEVIANKVWQGLAAGKTVITRDSAALKELAAVAGDRLQRVTGETARDIAAVLISCTPPATGEQPSMASRLEDFVGVRFASAFSASGLDRWLRA